MQEVELGEATRTTVQLRHHLPKALWYRPLYPEPVDQGDPFVLRAPSESGAAHRYYCYTTVDGRSHDGRAFFVYASDDLVTWRKLEMALIADPRRAHWAPCVEYAPQLERPYVMFFSKGEGHGDMAHRNQRIYRADSLAPEGPFVETGDCLTPDLDFAIDPDIFPLPDGTYRLIFATDFDTPDDFAVDRRAGTGLVATRVDSSLTSIIDRIIPLGRATSDWQIYDPARNDQHWKSWFQPAKPVRWHCIEAPASVSLMEVLYSGGNFNGYYAVGLFTANADGSWTDRSSEQSTALLRPFPDRGIYSIGRCSVVTGPDGELYAMTHLRERADAFRQMALVPLARGENGALFCPPP